MDIPDVFYAGYWAPTVGYYGGIDYGFGYTGVGYHGGYWRDHHFYYNRAVNNLGNAHIATVFNAPVPAPAAVTRVSYHGGQGGTTLRPTPAELAAAHEHHVAATAEQMRHEREASRIASLRYAENHGQPPIAAVERANEFHGAHVAAAAGVAGVAGAALAAHAALQRPAMAHAPRFAHAAPQNAMHGPAFHPNVAARGPAMHGPAFHPNFAAHGPGIGGPAFHPNFAAHGPAMGPAGGVHFGGAPNFAGGGAHFGGAPHFDGGGPHFGGAPGGGPRRP